MIVNEEIIKFILKGIETYNSKSQVLQLYIYGIDNTSSNLFKFDILIAVTLKSGVVIFIFNLNIQIIDDKNFIIEWNNRVYSDQISINLEDESIELFVETLSDIVNNLALKHNKTNDISHNIINMLNIMEKIKEVFDEWENNEENGIGILINNSELKLHNNEMKFITTIFSDKHDVLYINFIIYHHCINGYYSLYIEDVLNDTTSLYMDLENTEQIIKKINEYISTKILN